MWLRGVVLGSVMCSWHVLELIPVLVPGQVYRRFFIGKQHACLKSFSELSHLISSSLLLQAAFMGTYSASVYLYVYLHRFCWPAYVCFMPYASSLANGAIFIVSGRWSIYTKVFSALIALLCTMTSSLFQVNWQFARYLFNLSYKAGCNRSHR